MEEDCSDLIADLVDLHLIGSNLPDGPVRSKLESEFDSRLSDVPEEKRDSVRKISATLARMIQTRTQGQRDLTSEDKFKELFEANKILQAQALELKALTTDVDHAYRNLQHFTTVLESARTEKLKAVADIDKRLKAAGVPKYTQTRIWIRSVTAVSISIVVAVSLFAGVVYLGGAPPTASLEVTIDLGEIIQAMLVGASAIVAGVAYATSTARKDAAE